MCDGIKSKFLKWFFKHAGVIVVDRENPSIESMKEMIRVVKNNEILSTGYNKRELNKLFGKVKQGKNRRTIYGRKIIRFIQPR